MAATVQAQCPSYELTTVTNAARTRAGLEDILDRFREDIGGRSNGDRTGSQGSGRREVRSDTSIKEMLFSHTSIY